MSALLPKHESRVYERCLLCRFFYYPKSRPLNDPLGRCAIHCCRISPLASCASFQAADDLKACRGVYCRRRGPDKCGRPVKPQGRGCAFKRQAGKGAWFVLGE